MLDPRSKVDHSDMGRDKCAADRIEYCRLYLYKNGFISTSDNEQIGSRIQKWLEDSGCEVREYQEEVEKDDLGQGLDTPLTVKDIEETVARWKIEDGIKQENSIEK